MVSSFLLPKTTVRRRKGQPEISLLFALFLLVPWSCDLFCRTTVTSFSVLPRNIQRPAAFTSLLQKHSHTTALTRQSILLPIRFYLGLAATTAPSSSDDPTVMVNAQDVSGLQNLFDKHSDEDSLLDKATLEAMPPFAKMLADGELLVEEWNEIWDAVPKQKGARVNLDSFVKIYRDVDDLFDDNYDEDEEIEDDLEASSPAASGDGQSRLDEELTAIYDSICNDDGLISKESLKKWKEVQSLLVEGLLDEDEFNELWEATPKCPETEEELLDVSGFLSFNVALDGLFELEGDDYEEDDDDDHSSVSTSTRSMVVEGDKPPTALFSKLADDNYLVGMDELKLWVELQDLLEKGDLLSSELQNIYDKYVTADSSNKLTENAFLKLYDDIDALFEVESDDEDIPDTPAGPAQSQPSSDTVKKDLFAFLDLIDDGDDDALACGLDATEADQKQVLNIVNVLQQQSSNIILQKQGNIDLTDVIGTWELIYSSSSAMKFNKGLSGLGGSFPNGRFAGVKQTLATTKFLSDMEYKERIEVNPSSASFDVSVTGSWDLRTSVSIFTGQPSIVLNVEPERVNYGPTSTRADHWKSLGPMNMLDLSYLDEDLRIMRGCTSSDTLFIFKKIK